MGTRRGVAAAVCLVSMSWAWTFGGCGEDVFPVSDVTGDTSNQVGNGQLDLQITSPGPGETFLAGADVTVIGRVTMTSGSVAGLSWRVETDETVAGHGAKTGSLDATGDFTAILEGLGGGERTITVTIDPDGAAPVDETITVTILAPVAAPTWVAITPEAPTTVDDLDAAVTPAAADGQTARYRWSRDGETLGTGPRLGRDKTTRGDVITVSAWYEEDDLPSAETSAQVTIGNAAPACAQASLKPSGLATGDKDLSCECVGFSDPDGDAEASRCAFYDDADGGALIGAAGACTLPAAVTAKGMEIRCVLTPSDGQDDGEPVTALSTTGISNTPPNAPMVSLSPLVANAKTELTCEVTPGAPDADGDSVVHKVSWLVDDAPVDGLATVHTTGADLGAIHGQGVRCRVVADDGQSQSAPVTSDEVVLGNAPPTLVNVFVEADHTPPTKADTLTCAPQDGDDADGDTLSYAYTWSIDGDALTGETGATLSPDAFARGDKVSCTAAACDTAGDCSDPVHAKLIVTIGNAPPTVGGAGLVETPGYGGADGVAQPEDVLTCTYSGVEDLDDDTVELTFGFYLVAEDGTVTELQSGAGASYTVPEDLPEGASIHCTVTPSDELGDGPPTESGSFELVSPSPIAPTVTITAANGAEGDVTCSVTDPGRWLPDGAPSTVYWTVNGGAEVAGDATMTAAEVLSCDLVACRVVVGSGAAAVTSNTASLQMALGSDCDDGNPCTGMACLAEGGCKATLVSGPSCDDGDPCTVDDVCQSGVCTAGTQTCVEDRLSVSAIAGGPYVGPADDGGYAATLAVTGGHVRLRRTDGTASRTGAEADVAPSGDILFFGTPPADAGAGRVAVIYSAALPYIACNCGGYWPFGIYVRRLDALGAVVDEVKVFDFHVNAALGSYGGIPRILTPRADVFAHLDGGFGALGAYSNYGSPNPVKRALVYTRVQPNMMAQAPVTVVAAADLAHTAAWDADTIPDGADRFAVTWIAPDKRTVRAQRFAVDGTPEDATPIDVVVAEQDVTQVQVVGTRNGRFLVLWEANGLDGSGYGVAGRRYDDAGAPIGDAFQATGATAGDQRLGGVAALEGYDFVVAYSDASEGAAVARAQRFSASATPLGDAIRMNARSVLGGSPPSIARLDGDEWVGAWRDAAGVAWTRRYTADGELAPRAAERRVAETTVGDQRDADGARESGGNTLVAWSSPVYIGMGAEIVARVFDGEGVAVTGELAVNDYIEGPQSDPAVAAGPDRFVVAWTSEGEDGSVEGVYARRFDGAGAALGDAFGVPETTADTQRHPAVAMSAGGSFAIAWSGYTSAADNADVYVRLYGADGAAATGELRVNGTNTGGAQERPAIANIPFTDTWLVVWQTRHVTANGFDIYVRKVGADGATLSPELRVNAETDGDQRGPALAISQGDVTAVCWSSTAGGDSDVWCQLLKTSNLAAQGAPFRVHADLAGNQEAPRLSWLSDGRLMVTYATESLDHDGFAVQTARFDNLGAQVGARRTMNRQWDGEQRAPWLVAYDDTVFVGYESELQDGDGYGVYFRALPLDP